MLSFPNAKINLGLNVTSKRADGYHNISSVFLPVPWKDALEVVAFDKLRFESSGLEIPGNANNNLVLKAYQLIKKDFDIPPVHIHLHKVIPMGAGLGGGSADASFMLKLLNEKFELGIANSQLEIYAKQLGADCPFFIENKPKLVSGIGEVFEEVEIDLSGYQLVIVNPGIHVSTQEAFGGVKPNEPELSIKEIMKMDISKWKDLLKNDFEESVFIHHPKIKAVKEELYQEGAVYASMTGSGSSVYGLFRRPLSPRIINQKTSFNCILE
ncbi:MAG: 4-(cytidine 5'-diphospho)-2-C-methyl-D-erythritol kinase [Reichenbachiella sp.]